MPFSWKCCHNTRTKSKWSLDAAHGVVPLNIPSGTAEGPSRTKFDKAIFFFRRPKKNHLAQARFHTLRSDDWPSETIEICADALGFSRAGPVFSSVATCTLHAQASFLGHLATPQCAFFFLVSKFLKPIHIHLPFATKLALDSKFQRVY